MSCSSSKTDYFGCKPSRIPKPKQDQPAANSQVEKAAWRSPSRIPLPSQQYKRRPAATGHSAPSLKEAKQARASNIQMSQTAAMQAQLLESHARLSRELTMLDMASPRLRHRKSDTAQSSGLPMTDSADLQLQALPLSRLSTATTHNTSASAPSDCRPTNVQQVDKCQKSMPQHSWQQAGQRQKSVSQPMLKATHLKDAGHAMSHDAAASLPQREDSSCTLSTPAKTQACVAVDSPTLYLTPCDAALDLLAYSEMQQDNWYTPPYEATAPDQRQVKPYQQHAGLTSARYMPSVSASDDLLRTVDNFPEEWLASHDYSQR